MLDFLVELSARKKLPQVLSLSLGSLGAHSCIAHNEAVKLGHTQSECRDFMQEQRQVCMFLSESQVNKISML